MTNFGQWLDDKRQEALKRLNGAKEDNRAYFSTMLVDLGVVYNATTPDGVTYIEPTIRP